MGAKKISKHGTLGEQDTSGAVAVNVNQVLEHCQSSTTNELFGATGKLPPKSAQMYEPRYVTFYQFQDEKAGTSWIGLNSVTNSEKGKIAPVTLVPGEYKLDLRLDKTLNKNMAHDLTGAVIGSFSSIGAADEDTKSLKQGRGLPNSYVDVHFVVQAKKFAVMDTNGVLDLGVKSSFSRIFTVPENVGSALLNMTLFSHSVLKRLKVQGTLYRRDFSPAEPDRNVRKSAKVGKEILKKALSSGERAEQKTRLDPDVDLKAVIEAFYREVAPDRLGNLDAVLRHFQCRTDDLIATLEHKYFVRFDSRGRFVRSSSSSS